MALLVSQTPHSAIYRLQKPMDSMNKTALGGKDDPQTLKTSRTAPPQTHKRTLSSASTSEKAFVALAKNAATSMSQKVSTA